MLLLLFYVVCPYPKQSNDLVIMLKLKHGILGVPISQDFSQAESIKYTLEQQVVFFARTVGHFAVAEDITPTHIDNFDQVLPVS